MTTQITQQDLHRIWSWNSLVPVTIEHCIHHLVTEAASRHPLALAISAWDASLTYGQLDDYSTRLATRLVRLGVARGSIVPLCFDKSGWTSVAILAVMKTGGASTLLDCTQPVARLRSMVRQVDPNTILSSDAQRNLASQLSSANVVLVSSSSLVHISDASTAGMPEVTPKDLAYVAFTSGSSGTPKGAKITHSNLASAIYHQKGAFGFDSSSRFVDNVAHAFDVAWLFWHVLAAGGTVCIPSEAEWRYEPIEATEKYRGTCMFTTPTLARAMDLSRCPKTLQKVFLGGEAVGRDDVRCWPSDIQVHNVYGPAECTIVTVACVLSQQAECVPALGTACGSRTWVIDTQNQDCLCPIGQIGELCIEGPLVGNGYLNDPQQTAKSFVQNPPWLSFKSGQLPTRDAWVYRTDDLVKYTQDGLLTYMGRRDAQAKLRGQRLELAEVESAIRRLISVSPRKTSWLQLVADVLAHPRTKSDVLVVCMAPRDSCYNEVFIQEIYKLGKALRRDLAHDLPSYMVPSFYLPVENVPLTPSGKTDRKTFRAKLHQSFASLLEEQSDSLEATTPLTAIEEKLRELWADTLRLKPTNIPIMRTFFELGGDSITVMTMIVTLRRELQVAIPVSILAIPELTIRSLAAIIDERLENGRIAKPIGFDVEAHARHIASKLAFPFNPRKHAPGKRPSTVFLTGATGYLGVYILRQLLEFESFEKVITLVRRRSQHTALQRLQAAFSTVGGGDLREYPGLEIWEGDLSEKNLGLNPRQWSTLRGQNPAESNVNTVIHNGAQVQWSVGYKALKAANVDSTRQLLQAAISSPAISKFIYISGGKSSDDVSNEHATSDTGYDQSKQVAERLVLRVARKIADCAFTIIKPGLIIGDTVNGVANCDDFLWRFIGVAVRLESYPVEAPESRITVRDTAWLSKRIVDQISCSDALETVEIRDGLPTRRLWEVVQEEAKISLQPLSKEAWDRKLELDLNSHQGDHSLWPVMKFLNEPLGVTARRKEPIEDCAEVEAALRSNIRHLHDIGFFTIPYSKLPELASMPNVWSRDRIHSR